MTAVPARVAGVPGDRPGLAARPRRLALARRCWRRRALAGVTEAYRVGGAQAIAALAYGTGDHPPRRQDRGARATSTWRSPRPGSSATSGIDMLAGPSEVLVIADETADPALRRRRPARPGRARPDGARGARSRHPARWPTRGRGDRQRQLARPAAPGDRGRARSPPTAPSSSPAEPRRGGGAGQPARPRAPGAARWPIRRRCCRGCGTPARCSSGRHTPEVVGDYVAGPNHVLPTGGTARFASALCTEDFVKRLSVIRVLGRGARRGVAAPRRARARGRAGRARGRRAYGSRMNGGGAA